MCVCVLFCTSCCRKKHEAIRLLLPLKTVVWSVLPMKKRIVVRTRAYTRGNRGRRKCDRLLVVVPVVPVVPIAGSVLTFYFCLSTHYSALSHTHNTHSFCFSFLPPGATPSRANKHASPVLPQDRPKWCNRKTVVRHVPRTKKEIARSTAFIPLPNGKPATKKLVGKGETWSLPLPVTKTAMVFW